MHKVLPQITKKVNRIQEFEIDESTKEELIYNFILGMKEDSSIKYLHNNDRMQKEDINNMLRLLSSSDLSKPNRIEDYGTNLWTTFNTIQENATKIVRNFKHNTRLENKILNNVLVPIYK